MEGNVVGKHKENWHTFRHSMNFEFARFDREYFSETEGFEFEIIDNNFSHACCSVDGPYQVIGHVFLLFSSNFPYRVPHTMPSNCLSFQFHSVVQYFSSLFSFKCNIFSRPKSVAVKTGFSFQKKEKKTIHILSTMWTVERFDVIWWTTHARTRARAHSKHETDTLHRNNNELIGLLLLLFKCNAYTNIHSCSPDSNILYFFRYFRLLAHLHVVVVVVVGYSKMSTGNCDTPPIPSIRFSGTANHLNTDNNNNRAKRNCWIVCRISFIYYYPQLNWLRSDEIKIYICAILLFMVVMTFAHTHTHTRTPHVHNHSKDTEQIFFIEIIISRSQKSHQSTVNRVRVCVPDAMMSDDKQTDFYRHYAIAMGCIVHILPFHALHSQSQRLPLIKTTAQNQKKKTVFHPIYVSR